MQNMKQIIRQKISNHPDSEVIKDPKNVVHYIVVTKAGSAGRALKTLENYINDIKINDKPLNKDLKYEFIDILKTSYTEEFLKDRVDDLISQLKEL